MKEKKTPKRANWRKKIVKEISVAVSYSSSCVHIILEEKRKEKKTLIIIIHIYMLVYLSRIRLSVFIYWLSAYCIGVCVRACDYCHCHCDCVSFALCVYIIHTWYTFHIFSVVFRLSTHRPYTQSLSLCTALFALCSHTRTQSRAYTKITESFFLISVKKIYIVAAVVVVISGITHVHTIFHQHDSEYQDVLHV